MEFESAVVFTTVEVANILKVKFDYVIDLINFGYLRTIKLHGNKITKAALMEFIETYDGVDLEKEILQRKKFQ